MPITDTDTGRAVLSALAEDYAWFCAQQLAQYVEDLNDGRDPCVENLEAAMRWASEWQKARARSAAVAS